MTEAQRRRFSSSGALTGIKPHTNYVETLMHLLKGYVGTGIFAMGDGFKNSGYVLGPALLFLLSVVNLHCPHQLVKCAQRIADREEEDVRPSYGETVHYTFIEGPPWFQRNAEILGVIVNINLYISEIGFCCVYFLFIAEHLRQVAAANGWTVSIYVMLAIIVGPMWISTLINSLKLLAPLSIFANLLMWLGIIIVVYFTVIGLPSLGERRAFAEPIRIPLFFGTAIFAFEGITFILQLRREMKNVDQFVSFFGVLNVALVLVTILYISVGFLAYWKFGENVKGSVFLNLDDKDILAQVVKILMCLAIVITFTLHMYIPFEIIFPMIHDKWGPFKHQFLIIFICKSVPVLITFLLANCVPFLHLFISLIGAASGTWVVLICPPILEMIAFRGELKIWSYIKNILIILIGFVGMILGSVLSIMDIVTAFQEGEHNKE